MAQHFCAPTNIVSFARQHFFARNGSTIRDVLLGEKSGIPDDLGGKPQGLIREN
jgi:hypothetical protein